MKRIVVSCLLTGALAASPAPGVGQPEVASAATPTSGTISSQNPTVSWTGGPFLTSNPTFCLPADPACDTFQLTVAQPLPRGDYLVKVAIDGQFDSDDYDLFVFGPDGEEVGSATTPSGDEEVTLFNPAAATYAVVVQAWLVTPGSTYAGQAHLLQAPAGEKLPRAKAFAATQMTRASYEAGTPTNGTASFPGQPLRVAAHAVGREAAEPTLGVNPDGTVFYAAATFDAIAGGLARTEVMRSRDDGASWVSVQQGLLMDTTTEPPTTLDPYVHVDPGTGRVFTIDLYVGCSYLLFSDTEGESWQRNPLACGQPVNDHHTIQTGPPAGVAGRRGALPSPICADRLLAAADGRLPARLGHAAGRLRDPAGGQLLAAPVDGRPGAGSDRPRLQPRLPRGRASAGGTVPLRAPDGDRARERGEAAPLIAFVHEHLMEDLLAFLVATNSG